MAITRYSLSTASGNVGRPDKSDKDDQIAREAATGEVV